MEDTIANELVSNGSADDIDFTARKKHGKQALRIDETDSEDDNVLPLADPVHTDEIIDGNNSDESSNETKESSDDGDQISLSTQRKKKRRKKKSDEQDVNDEHKSKINALCDEESSSDESDRQVEAPNSTKTQRAPQRMSAKQAEEQMKIIQSESQRMARECHLSVPYHKPKQHSLKDFLNRRTINRPVPMALTKKAAATIKMTREELEQYAKSLEDRNKESQEFYRSDSDNSNNDDEEKRIKCDEQDTFPQCDESNAQAEATETVALIEESVEPTTDVMEPTPVDNIEREKSNEATTDDIQLTEAVSVVGDAVEATKVFADVSDVATENLNEINTEDASSIIAVNETGVHRQDSALNAAKETIEIDYDFGESERNEIKTLKDLLSLCSTSKPCLKGPLNGVIDLDVDDVKPIKSGGDESLARFIKHVATKPNRSAKEVSILSTDNGFIEMNNVQIELDDPNCIHSKPRKDVFKLKQELSL